MIIIKLINDDKEYIYNSFDDIPNVLNEKIIYLSCSNNNIKSIPNKYINLEDLYCNNNNITYLPSEYINLKYLSCLNNNLTNLPKEYINLIHLNCSYNNIINLPPEYINLKKLLCSNNNLINLPKEYINLKELYCYNNQLVNLPNEYINIKIIDCSLNNLTSLPDIHKFIYLKEFYYSDNPIEYIPPNINRLLNKLKKKINKLQLFNDTQNIHNHQIQESIKNSINRIMYIKPDINYDTMFLEIIENKYLSDDVKACLIEYCNIYDVHSILNITFKELFLSVWNIIRSHNDYIEIYKIINIEIKDSMCKCFTGRMSRLVNCLNGFDDRVNINISDNDQISNIIIIIKESLEDNYSIDKHKELVIIELKNRGYNDDIINEWIEFIE